MSLFYSLPSANLLSGITISLAFAILLVKLSPLRERHKPSNLVTLELCCIVMLCSAVYLESFIAMNSVTVAGLIFYGVFFWDNIPNNYSSAGGALLLVAGLNTYFGFVQFSKESLPLEEFSWETTKSLAFLTVIVLMITLIIHGQRYYASGNRRR